MSFQMMGLLIELALSLHFFLRCRAAFGGGWWQWPLLVWLAGLAVAMLSRGRFWEPDSPWQIFTWLGALWLGFLIIFMVAALGLDVIRLMAGLAGALGGKSWWGLLAAKRAVPAALGLTILLTAHAYYQAYHPRLMRLEIMTDKLPAGEDSLRVVQMTDIHLSRLIGLEDLRRMADLVVEADPDLLVVTGDLVDADMSGRAAEAGLLAALRPRYGAFAVTGNHERYAGEENALNFFQASGLRLLRGEAEEAGGLIVAGVDDEVFGGRRDCQPAGQLLAGFRDDGRFVLFLKHRPTPTPGAEGLFDLQLSGHTHGGQIWPGHFLIKRVNGMLHGLTAAPGGRGMVYTSRGTGFWGLPLRFLAPSEVTLIELKRP